MQNLRMMDTSKGPTTTLGGCDENQDATLRKTTDGTSQLKVGEQNSSRVPDLSISLKSDSRPGYSNEEPLDKENTC